MVAITKKTGARGTSGGFKFICDVCSADITSTVRIACDTLCENFHLCVPCFSEGKTTHNHDPQTHKFKVQEQHSIPIYTEDWGADEELALLEGAETYGLGSWADIADHIGGYRTKDEVRDHYLETYINSSKFPLPEHADINDKELSTRIPREEFQARKKRRIEERKEEAKNAPPATPKQKPTASVPSCHEVQGYMPGRLEFETEYFNEAEEAVQHMQFEPGDGLNEHGQEEPEMHLKMTVMDIYNSRLTARVERKKIIFEHKLLEYRKNQAQDKKRTKEQKDLMNKAKPFARMMKHEDFEEFCQGLEYEHDLRLAITQLQEWRSVQIGELRAGEKYEHEKFQRQSRPPAVGQFDRMATNRNAKPAAQTAEGPTANSLTAPNLEIPFRSSTNGVITPPTSVSSNGNTVNGTSLHTNGVPTPQAANIASKPKFSVQPLPNTVPLKFEKVAAPDLQLLTEEERELCSALRIMPKPYMAIKENMFKEALKSGGMLKKKTAKEISKIDAAKVGKLFDFFVHSGWIGKA
ncbi:transcriptional adaptor 2 [Pseudovirgaria hyperparasitica]|uniref:Transcriptional adapter 2 n=1 Tax=Pseudovirgaria hyperparasitica TaxID=470096 RepID=A0A6A6WLY1_9PEZI|nr:transcriptional adaptor 2 [Pseudovirgaria hyperparasitica]KAF2763204.1 transcriptional adaptor 2 [Pseudovirgaria hyperparasitica]